MNKSSARAPLGAREGFEQTIGGAQGGLLPPNDTFKRSEPLGLGVRPQMTGKRIGVVVLLFRSHGVCQLGTERIRRAGTLVAERRLELGLRCFFSALTKCANLAQRGFGERPKPRIRMSFIFMLFDTSFASKLYRNPLKTEF